MKILLATDGSELSESAAKFLTRIPWTRNDSITVFHAIYAVPFESDAAFHYHTLAEIKKEIAPRILDATVAVLNPVAACVSVDICEFSPDRATPEQCILDAQKSLGADLVVLGQRGVRGLASVFLGSVTRMVAIKSPAPVLVVHAGEEMPRENIRVLFAADGTDDSKATGDFLCLLPFPDDTEVTIVNIPSSGYSDIPERFIMEVDDRIKDIVAHAREREFADAEKIIDDARRQLGTRFRNIQAISRVGTPSMEILRAGDEVQADIIAVGGGGMRGIKGLLGSVSRNILAHSKRTVLIGKHAGA